MTEDKSTFKPVKAGSSSAQKELDRAEKQFEKFDEEVKAMTLDRMNQAPKHEVEQQTKMSQNQLADSKDVYLKPKRSIMGKDKFNEKFREDYEYAREYVKFFAENKENIGETIDIWTRPFGGMPAEEWDVPTNKPVWGPRYLAEQIKRKSYHRLVMQDRPVNTDGFAQYYGTMSVDSTIQRLDAHPVSNKKSIFMGGNF